MAVTGFPWDLLLLLLLLLGVGYVLSAIPRRRR